MARSREVSLVLSVPCLLPAVCLPSSSFPHLPICPHLPLCSLHLSLVGSPGRLRRAGSEAALGTQLGMGGCETFGGCCHPGTSWVVLHGALCGPPLGRRPRYFMLSNLIVQLLPVTLCSLRERALCLGTRLVHKSSSLPGPGSFIYYG